MVYSTLCLIQEQKDSLASDEPESGSTSEKVIRYINRNLQNKITLKELADYAGLSPYYFSRLFKKETGHSPLEYVALSKINYSKLMLRTSKMPISEIAETLGYSSTASYINAFNARRGLTPFFQTVLHTAENNTAAPDLFTVHPQIMHRSTVKDRKIPVEDFQKAFRDLIHGFCGLTSEIVYASGEPDHAFHRFGHFSHVCHAPVIPGTEADSVVSPQNIHEVI